MKLYRTKLGSRFMSMGIITLAAIIFLFFLSYIGFKNITKNIRGISTLNAMNQNLSEAIISEKKFLPDYQGSSFKSAVNSIHYAISDIDALPAYSIFESADIETLRYMLKTYEISLSKLSVVIRALQAKDKEISDKINQFGLRSIQIADLVNKYESQCQLERQTPNIHLLRLRDLSRDSVIAMTRLFLVLKNQQNIESLKHEAEYVLTVLKNYGYSASLIRDYIEYEVRDEAFFDYIRLIDADYHYLNTAVAEISELWKINQDCLAQSDAIRKQVLNNKEKMSANANLRIDTISRRVIQGNVSVFLFMLIILTMGLLFVGKSVVSPIVRIIEPLNMGADQVASASENMSQTSQSLAESASQQSASLSETSVALNQIFNISLKNTEISEKANCLMEQVKDILVHARHVINELSKSVTEISDSGIQTQKIIHIIDGITFQTRLLSLNAAIEAARVGDQGAGFAVVADEMRRLSTHTAEAARNSTELIADSVKKTDRVLKNLTETNKVFSDMNEQIHKAGSMVYEIRGMSQEQSAEIGKINSSVQEIDSLTRHNSACSQESASIAQQMNAQAVYMRQFVEDLAAVAGLRAGGKTSPKNVPAVQSRLPDSKPSDPDAALVAYMLENRMILPN
ncbi:MAG TPA: hypothetical protein DCQ37_16695 [Desulfobacteraceae bacterium]|nr:hypothetical protein [Desulfobacteraceae bacterium]